MGGSLLLLTAALAWAHHPGVPEHASSPWVSLESVASGYDFAAGRGTYLTTAARGEVWAGSRVAFGAVVPWHFVFPDAAAPFQGIGDIELSGRVVVLRAPFELSAGLGVELPTADADWGLGQGHAHLMPFVAAKRGWGPWMLHGGLGWGQSLAFGGMASHDHHMHGEPAVIVEPHGDEELHAHLGGMGTLGAFGAGVMLEGAFPFDGETAPFVDARVDAGWTRGRWRVGALGALPLVGDRFAWRAGVTARALIGKVPSRTHGEHDHEEHEHDGTPGGHEGHRG